MSKKQTAFRRPQATVRAERLAEPRRLLNVIAGPRQVGKSILVQQVTDELSLPVRYASADEPTLRGADWISQQWEAARLQASGGAGALLVLDAIQKISFWSETVKRLWDEDTRPQRPLTVVLLGSAPLLMAQRLTERLARRFETLRRPHWSYAEMREAFGFTLEEYLYFGSYPGAAPLIRAPVRWACYIADRLIEISLARDVSLLTRVDKPALLRRPFELACRYSGQILSYTNMFGSLQDVGNTTTLAHYLDLLAGAGWVCGLRSTPVMRRADEDRARSCRC